MTTGFVTDPVTGKKTIDKSPGAVLDYIESWVDWLAAVGETISSATVTISGPDNALIKNSHIVVGGTSVHVWLSAGTPNVKYAVLVHIVTPTRQDDRTFYVKVKTRNA